MTKSILVSAFILLCAVIIESSILSNISFIYIVPDLVLICSIYFSLLNGKVVGETTGFISGLLLDFVTGIPFGFNWLFRAIIGYVYGIFAKNVIISDNEECYFAYRMYDIAHEVTELLNYQIMDTRAYNKVSLIGFQRRDYSDNFHGIQIIFNFMLNSNLSGTPALPDFENRMVVRPH